AHASWTTWGGDPSHSLMAAKPLDAPLGVLWKFAAALPKTESKEHNVGGVIIDGNTLYFASKNVVYAIDASTGQMKWRQPPGDPEADGNGAIITATPAVGGGMLFVPDSSGLLTVYNAADGARLWEFKAGKAIRGAPIVMGDVVYFGSDDFNVYAVD